MLCFVFAVRSVTNVFWKFNMKDCRKYYYLKKITLKNYLCEIFPNF
ncbi:hypothetical protein SAMN05428975_1854 [Mucilaginibacter sp. OK268]|nr:hypothetical protein SAMN05428975_1854 [Mucilaginibacter sp. OK268]